MLRAYDAVTRFFLSAVQPYDLADKPPSDRVLPYLYSHLRPLRRVILASLVITVLAATIEVWLIRYAGQIVDILVDQDPRTLVQNHGANLVFAGITVLLFRPIIQFLRYALNEISLDCNIATLVRWRAYDHLIKQSVGWFQEDLTGRTSGRLVDIGNHAAMAIYGSLNAIAFGLVYMIGLITMIAGVDLKLAAPLLIWLALYLACLAYVIPRMVKAQQKFQSSKSGLVGSVVDSFSNFDTLKLFAPKDLIASEQRVHLERTRQSLFEARQIAVGLRSTLVILEGIIMVGFIGYGIYLWMSASATIGIISAGIALSLRMTTMAEWILDSVWAIFLSVGSLREALLTISQPVAIPQSQDVPPLAVTRGEICFENVHHHYGLDQGGLSGVTLKIAAGEKVGIVGRSGVGKSTLANLLPRFFDVEQGKISIDGQDIRNVDQDSLRAQIGMVSQQAALLNKSVQDNVLLGRRDVSDHRLTAAMIEACAHDFVMELQDSKGRTGYDAHVGERGVKLSGGQRQRIAIARVILKDSPILILDEATSALDSVAEVEVQNALYGVMEGKTVLAIAHRLSTLAQMDRIIVLDKGQIAEEGTHEDLLSAKGLYAELWSYQSGGYLDAEEPKL